MYAIIESGGKQYRVEKGIRLQVEKTPVGDDKSLIFDKVLTVVQDSGETTFGKPYISGVRVVAEHVEDGKDDKILIHKYKRRKKYRLTQGHRQSYTEVIIKDIAV